MMLAMLVRQSLKAVLLGYVLCLLAAVAIVIYWETAAAPPAFPMPWPLLLPLVLLAFVAMRHMQRRLTKIVVTADRLRYESGLLSKTTENIELSKVQDVRVVQRLAQRLFNIGDISLETAGSSSRIAMPSIDRPQETATHILDMVRAAGKQQPPGQAGL
jgi:membrane protein YdbS with pleckstrin-like domain